MRDLSIKGITRQHAGFFTRISIANNGGVISLREHIINGNGSARQNLEDMARMEISYSMSECVFGWTVAYQQTWSHISMRINLNPDAGISAATMTALRNTWETAIQNRWTDVWGAGRNGELTCPFSFDLQWVNTGAHHNVRVRTGPARSNMTTWDTSDTGAVASHEFGHMIGNADEYTTATCPSRSPVNTGVIMDNNSNNIPSRLLQGIVSNIGSNEVSL